MLSVENINNILANLKDKTIFVFGDLMLDQYIEGNVNKISQEAPIPIVNATNEDSLLGGAANVASNLHDLNINTYLSGAIGSDNAGEKILEILDHKGINSTAIATLSEARSITKVRVVSANQQLLRFDIEDPKDFQNLNSNEIIEILNKANPDLIYISDYNKGLNQSAAFKDIFKYALENNKKLMVDPKINQLDLYKGAYLFKPNLKEALEFTQAENYKEAAKILNQKLDCNILITLSEKGAYLLESSGEECEFKSLNKKARDVSGAGDTLGAFIPAGIASGASLKDSIEFGMLGAAISVSKYKTASVLPEEILTYMNQ